MISISSIFNLGKKVLLISILILKLDKNIINITIISANIYYAANKLKKTQVFIISMRNLKFQVIKKAKPETDPKNIILKKYYDFLDIFLKKT